MILLISPAKTLDFEQKANTAIHSENAFLPEAEKLIKKLKQIKAAELSELMGISQKLAQLNFERFQNWSLPFNENNAKQSVFAFRGEVYTGLNADTLSEKNILFAQEHLRILSGLYGVLRPLDLIQPYRLEMGTLWKTKNFGSLYEYWGEKLTKNINAVLAAQKNNFLINLASNEYFKAINTKKIKAEIISPVFKDFSHGEYKIVSVFAKKARGLMSRFIIDHEIQKPDELKLFDSDGYYFSEAESKKNQLVYLRG